MRRHNQWGQTLISKEDPWRGLEDVEFATRAYIDCSTTAASTAVVELCPGLTSPAAS